MRLSRGRFWAPAIGALAVAGIAIAGCGGSSIKSALGSTETIRAGLDGTAAAANLNSNSSAPLTFPEGVYSGPVNLTVKPFPLPGGNGPSGTATLNGGLKVHHVAEGATANTNAPPPAKWTLRNGNCYFVADFSKGTFKVLPGSTGKFAGATGEGVYNVTATGWAPIAKGKTACSFNNLGGPVSPQGASVEFVAVGHLKVKS